MNVVFDGIKEMLSQLSIWFFSNLDGIIGGFCIFVLLSLFSKTLAKLFSKFVEKLNGKNEIIAEGVYKSLLRPLGIFFIILGAYVGLSLMRFPDKVQIFFNNTFRIAIILSVAWAFSNFMPYVSEMLFKNGKGINAMAKVFTSNVMKVIIVCIAVVIIISELGYNISGLITGLGLGGLTLSLAAKSTAQNFFSSFSIVSYKPFDIGDYIKTPDVEGTVEEINMRNTRIRTVQGAQTIVPNSVICDTPITNFSRMGRRLSCGKVEISYDTNGETLNACIEKIKKYLQENDRIHGKDISVTFEKFTNTSLILNIIYYTKTTQYYEHIEAVSTVNFEIKKIVEEMGIDFSLHTSQLKNALNENDKENQNEK